MIPMTINLNKTHCMILHPVFKISWLQFMFWQKLQSSSLYHI